MQLNFYRPVINPAIDLTGHDLYNFPLPSELVKLVNGENTANDIISKLLVRGYDIGDIIKVLEDLKTKGVLMESPESDLSVFSDEELAKYDGQLQALTKTGFDKTSILLPFSPSALSHQRRLKEATITIIGDGKAVHTFIANLSDIGIGTIHYYALNLEVEEEQELTNKLIDNDTNFSDVYIHRIVSNDFDAAFFKSVQTDIVVYISERFSQEYALSINKACKDAKIDFLPYQCDFPLIHIGPFYLYKQSACYKCYTLRNEGSIANYHAQSKAPEYNGWNVRAGLDMLTLEVMKYYSYIMDLATADKVWTFDMISGNSYLDTTFKLPRCPLCGVSKIKPAQKLWESI